MATHPDKNNKNNESDEDIEDLFQEEQFVEDFQAEVDGEKLGNSLGDRNGFGQQVRRNPETGEIEFSENLTDPSDIDTFAESFRAFIQREQPQLNVDTDRAGRGAFNVFTNEPVDTTPETPEEFISTLKQHGTPRQQKLGAQLEQQFLQSQIQRPAKEAKQERRARQRKQKQIRIQRQQEKERRQKTLQNFIERKQENQKERRRKLSEYRRQLENIDTSTKAGRQSAIAAGKTLGLPPDVMSAMVKSDIEKDKERRAQQKLERQREAKQQQFQRKLDINQEERARLKARTESPKEFRTASRLLDVRKRLEKTDDQEKRAKLKMKEKDLKQRLQTIRKGLTKEQQFGPENFRTKVGKQIQKRLSELGQLNIGTQELLPLIKKVKNRVGNPEDATGEEINQAVKDVAKNVPLLVKFKDASIQGALEDLKDGVDTQIHQKAIDTLNEKQRIIKDIDVNEENLKKEFVGKKRTDLDLVGSNSAIEREFDGASGLNSFVKELEKLNFDTGTLPVKFAQKLDDLTTGGDKELGNKIVRKIEEVKRKFEEIENPTALQTELKNFYNEFIRVERGDVNPLKNNVTTIQEYDQLRKLLENDIISPESLMLPVRNKLVSDFARQVQGENDKNIKQMKQVASMIEGPSVIQRQGQSFTLDGKPVGGTEMKNDISAGVRSLADPQTFSDKIDRLIENSSLEIGGDKQTRAGIELAADDIKGAFMGQYKDALAQTIGKTSLSDDFKERLSGLSLSDSDFLEFTDTLVDNLSKRINDMNAQEMNIVNQLVSGTLPDQKRKRLKQEALRLRLAQKAGTKLREDLLQTQKNSFADIRNTTDNQLTTVKSQLKKQTLNIGKKK